MNEMITAGAIWGLLMALKERADNVVRELKSAAETTEEKPKDGLSELRHTWRRKSSMRML